MNEVLHGIAGFNSYLCKYNLTNNNLRAWQRGIDIINAEFANNISILNNEILMNFYGGDFAINVSASTIGNPSNVKIFYNNITIGNTYSQGINIQRLNKTTLMCNTINRYNGLNSTISLHGFQLSGCVYTSLITNKMQWASNQSNPASNGIDYLFTTSTQTFSHCNVSGVSRVGFKVSGDNTDLTFRSNVIGSHHIGLLYDQQAMAGTQPAIPSAATEGNKWVGTYINLGAENTSNPFNVYDSRYFYNTGQASFYRPDTWYPPTWFDAGGSIFHQPACTTGACVYNAISPMGNDDYYRAIANGSITTIGYPEQTRWMAQGTLIRALSNDSILLNSDDSLNYFYFAPENQTLRNLRAIEVRNNDHAEERQLISFAIQANDSLLYNMSNNMSLLLSDTLMHDSIYFALSENLKEQFNFLNETNETYYYDISNLLNENIGNAKSINDTMETSNANERILQTVQEIYFRLHENNYEFVPYEDSTMLAYIANLCPLAAGPAVFQARDMYALLVDSVIYQDSAKCANEGYTRQELQTFETEKVIKKSMVSYFKAYPIPSKNNVELSFNELNKPANLLVYNLQGQLLQSVTMQKGLSKYTLNIEQFSEGIYQVVFVNDNQINRVKICKIK
jgi:hypothetical protein